MLSISKKGGGWEVIGMGAARYLPVVAAPSDIFRNNTNDRNISQWFLATVPV